MTLDDALAILELSDDSLDRKAVKRAYGQQLRQTRPEEDPAGFMALRDAYDLVRNYVAFQQTNASSESMELTGSIDDVVIRNPSLDAEDLTVDPKPEPHTTADYITEIDVREIDPVQQRADEFYDLIDKVVSDPALRNDLDAWRGLIRPRREESVDDFVIFDAMLRERLIKLYNAEIEQRAGKPEPAFPTPPIAPSLAAGIFKGMDWDDTTAVDHLRHAQIKWLEDQMDFRHVYKTKARPTPTPENHSNGVQLSGWSIFWIIMAILFVLGQILAFFDNPTSRKSDEYSLDYGGYTAPEFEPLGPSESTQPNLEVLSSETVSVPEIYTDESARTYDNIETIDLEEMNRRIETLRLIDPDKLIELMGEGSVYDLVMSDQANYLLSEYADDAP